MAPRPGDFGVTRISGIGGRAIRLGQWLNGSGFADYEHAFIVMGSTEWVVEAEPDGAVYDLNQYYPEDTKYSTIPLTDQQRTDIVRIAYSLVGTPYSWADYLSIALHRLHVRPAWVMKRLASSGHMICSQLVDYAYRSAGVELFLDGRAPGDVTPGDLVQVLDGPR